MFNFYYFAVSHEGISIGKYESGV